MKKIISAILSLSLIFALSGNVFAVEDKTDPPSEGTGGDGMYTVEPDLRMPGVPLKDFDIYIVDKDGIPMQNAAVVISPTDKKYWISTNHYQTDTYGKIIGIHSYSDYIKPDSYNLPAGDYDIKVYNETVKHTFTASNTKKPVTIKIPVKNGNEVAFNAEKRTDIYLKNSKNQPVRNMRIELLPTFQVPQPSDPSDAGISAYTNKDGRVTFSGQLRSGIVMGEEAKYSVAYSWKGGKSSGGKISIDPNKKINTFNFKFDEKLLQK